MKYVALLRGINVGGKNILPMRSLAELFGEAGARNVRTYIQSGNVVFEAVSGRARLLPERVSERIAERYGYRIPVIVRTADELSSTLCGNPFLAAGAAENTLHVLFLARIPSPLAVAMLDPARSPSDEFAVIGKDVYLRLPAGFARTKLTNAYFDAKLETVSTARNWRTLCKLATLMT